MMLLWMAYGTLVGGLFALAALAAERGARLARVPARWIWLGAMAATLAFTARAAIGYAARGVELPARTTAPDAARAVVAAGQTGWAAAVARAREAVREGLNVVRWDSGLGARGTSGRANALAILVWAGATLLLFVLWAAVHRRMARARSGWPRAELHGVPVRLSVDAGPAVIGLRHAEVVVPRWLLVRAQDEQRMVVAHEAEHVRARDPLLLAAAWGAVIVAPWSAALWFMLSRLRLAIELDCDARVLRAGTAPHAYGSLLIDVAQHSSLTRHAALALAGRPSHLRQRIVAMQMHTPRFAIARAGLIGSLSVAALLAACEAKLPTAADVDSMTASSAVQAAKQFNVIARGDTLVYRIDGAQVSAEEARALPPERLGAVNVTRGPDGRAEVSITTKDGRTVATGVAYSDSAAAMRRRRRADGKTPGSVVSSAAEGQNLAYFIDGKKVDAAALQALDPKTIASVEVLKGNAARALYALPDVSGVIVVKTKTGAGGQ